MKNNANNVNLKDVNIKSWIMSPITSLRIVCSSKWILCPLNSYASKNHLMWEKNLYLVWGNLAHVLQLLLESVLTPFICCPPCCSANQRPPPSEAQPMGALPAPPLRRNSCGHLGKLSRHPAPVVSTARACWFGKLPQKTDLSEHISKVAIDPPSSPRASLQ